MASPSRQIPRKGHPEDDVKAADEGVWKHVPSYDNLAAMLPGEETGVLKTTLRRSFTTVKTTLQRIFNSSDRWSGKTSSNGSANLQPQSAPVPVPPPTPNKGSGDPEAIRRHDLFNITCTGFIVAIVYLYLFIATEYAKVRHSLLNTPTPRFTHPPLLNARSWAHRRWAWNTSGCPACCCTRSSLTWWWTRRGSSCSRRACWAARRRSSRTTSPRCSSA
jgi:hypothetical protein